MLCRDAMRERMIEARDSMKKEYNNVLEIEVLKKEQWF